MDSTLLKVQKALLEKLELVNQKLGSELNDYQRTYYLGRASALKELAVLALKEDAKAQFEKVLGVENGGE